MNGAVCRPSGKDVGGSLCVEDPTMSLRDVSVRDDVLREWSENEETGVVRLGGFQRSCEGAFVSPYDETRELCAALSGQDGLAIVAIDEAGVAASAFLPRLR